MNARNSYTGHEENMDKKQAHRKAEKAYVDSLERDLKRACHLLREANPERRAWMEERDRFLESVGEFKDPPE